MRPRVARGPGLCDNCGANQRKRQWSNGVLTWHAFCTPCYNAGCRLRQRNTEGCRFDRPKALMATGMMVEDATNTLIHPDGRRERPVPPWVITTHWLETVKARPGDPVILRVMRPVGAQENPQPAGRG